MVVKSRWRGAHDKFPAHVDDAKNSDGTVHRGYSLLEFRVAAELLRLGPVHSANDYWAPSDWQLLLVVSEYMSAMLEFLDWFWPDLGWEHHKQAIVLSKRLLQPRSPNTYPELQIDPQLRVAWQSFTYCFWHGTRHLPAAPPSGEPSAVYNAAREWLTKLVGERGFEAEGHIVSSLQSWIQSMRPRLQEAFPAVDWSRWPAVVWPEQECAFRGVEKRGAVKRRQQEEDYAVRWPLRVTQGRPKFNHLKLEARDGFVVGIPQIKNPPALAFLAVSDVMCAFKQAAQHWPSMLPGSPAYLAQQDVVQNFVQNVLRETRGPLAPGISHEKYRHLGYVACSVLGWNNALSLLVVPVTETAAWGPQPLALPGGAAAMMHAQQHPEPQLQLNAMGHLPDLGLRIPPQGLLAAGPLDPGICIDLGIASQLAMQPELLLSPETEAALAIQAAAPPAVPPLTAGASTAARAAAGMADAVQGFADPRLPLFTRNDPASQLVGQSSAALLGGDAAQPSRQVANATRPRPSPFLTRSNSASTSAGGGSGNQKKPGVSAVQQPADAQGEVAAHAADPLDGPAPMSLSGLSSMQDLIDGLPSQADLTWSSILGAVGGDDGGPGAVGDSPVVTTGTGTSGTISELMAALPSLLLPSWTGLRASPPSHPNVQIPNFMKLQEHHDNGDPLIGTLAGASSGLQAYGGLFQTLPSPGSVRSAPDAPVHIQPPSGSTSTCQATITTGALPSLGLPFLPLGSHGLPSLVLPSSGLSRPELSGTDTKFSRRSHGEVSTLSPVASCGPNGEVEPCSPAPPGASHAAANEEAATAPAGLGPRRDSSLSRDRDVPAASLPSGSRRTRQDVAAAAAAAAADQGLAPAPGSVVERCAKRSNSRVGPHGPVSTSAVVAERVDSLGVFLTDQLVGLVGQPVESLSGPVEATSRGSAGNDGDRKALGLELLQLLRAWAEESQTKEQAEDASFAEVHRRAEELLAQGAPVDATEEDDAVPAASTAGYTPLHWACLRGDVALVELLLRHGADPESCDASGTPARLVNPSFAPTLAEAAARCAAHSIEAAGGGAVSTNRIRSGSEVMASIFASSAGTAAAQAVTMAEAAAQQIHLRERLTDLLRSADQVAAQLASRDPQTAASEVLDVMRDTKFLYPCIVSGAAAAQ